MTRRLGGTMRLRLPRTRSKYGAVKTTVDGIAFASRAEARRYHDLRLLERAGQIQDLELQPVFPLVVAGLKVGLYRGDFRYIRTDNGEVVTEDVKGMRTPVYRIKRKLVQALYGISIAEVA